MPSAIWVSSGVAPSLGGDQGAQFLRHVRVDAEMDRDPAPAALQRRFIGADEVLGLFLELHVGVADQAERALAGDAEAGEQPVKEQAHQIVEHHEADRLADRARQPDEPLDLAGQRQQGPHALPVLLAQQQQGHHQAHVGDERERMRRVDRERRQHREHPLHEPRVEPLHIVGRELLGLAHLDAGLAQQAAQFAPHPLLLGEQRFGAELDLGKLLRRRPPVGRHRGEAGLRLADQSGDADRVELVQVGRADRDEAHAFQQRMARVLGLLDHAVVEVEPGKLAVDEPVGTVRRDRGLVGWRLAAAGRSSTCAELLPRARTSRMGCCVHVAILQESLAFLRGAAF